MIGDVGFNVSTCQGALKDEEQDNTLTNETEENYLIYNKFKTAVTELPGSCNRSYPAAGIRGVNAQVRSLWLEHCRCRDVKVELGSCCSGHSLPNHVRH